MFDEYAYSISLSISKNFNYNNIQFLLFMYDAISLKWWSNNRKEIYLPFFELILNKSYKKSTLLVSTIFSKSSINGKLGLDLQMHNNLFLRGGFESSGIFSFGTGIKMNFIEFDVALVFSNNNPLRANQQFTFKLLSDKALSELKRLTP